MTVVVPSQFIALGLMTGDLNPTLAVAGVLLMVLHIACLPIWQHRQRQFYSSTLWSRENGIDPKGLKLFNWRGNRELG